MSAERDKARVLIGNVNNYAEDDGTLSISAFGPLSDRIAAALSEARAEVWREAIVEVRKVSAEYEHGLRTSDDYEYSASLGCAVGSLEKVIAALERAAEGKRNDGD